MYWDIIEQVTEFLFAQEFDKAGRLMREEKKKSIHVNVATNRKNVAELVSNITLCNLKIGKFKRVLAEVRVNMSESTKLMWDEYLSALKREREQMIMEKKRIVRNLQSSDDN